MPRRRAAGLRLHRLPNAAAMPLLLLLALLALGGARASNLRELLAANTCRARFAQRLSDCATTVCSVVRDNCPGEQACCRRNVVWGWQ